MTLLPRALVIRVAEVRDRTIAAIVIGALTALTLSGPAAASTTRAPDARSVNSVAPRAAGELVPNWECADVAFIGVRGSGERGDDEYAGFGPKIKQVLGGFGDALRSEFTYKAIAVEYPSLPIRAEAGFDGSLVDDLLSYGNGVPPSPTRDYADSVQQGTFALLDAIIASNTNCPEERIVLAGYSQGALVIHRVLMDTTLGNKLAAVVLLADPARDTIHGNPTSGTTFGNAGESLGIWLTPVSGVVAAAYTLGAVSSWPYRLGAAAYFASLGPTSGYQLWDSAAAASNPHMRLDASVAAKTIEMCAATDLVCDTQLGFGGDWYGSAVATHIAYGKDEAAPGYRAADVRRLGELAADRVHAALAWEYTVESNGSATITGTTLPGTTLRIPAAVDGHRVSTIGDNALSRKGLTSITIPDSVTSIGSGAFEGNALTSVSIPSNVKTIGQTAFANNLMTQVDIADGVRTIDGGAFADNDLTSVNTPSSVTTIGDYAFARNALTTATMAQGVETIGDGAFTGNALTSVVIPDGVKRIGGQAFWKNSLTSVRIPGSVVFVGDGAFETNRLATAIIEDGVAEIGARTFENNALTEIAVPGSVATIGASAFRFNNLRRAVVHDGVAAVGAAAFANNVLTDLSLPDTVTSMGGSTFYGNALTHVTIPRGLTTIPEAAFYGNALTSVAIPSGVTSIEGGAFGANKLTSVALPNSLTTIGNGAFSSNSLTSISIPASVTALGEEAFSSNALSSVTLSGSLSVIGNRAFQSNKIANVVVPGSVKSIGRHAFAFNALSSVTISNGVETIGLGAFESNALTKVTIPASVSKIEGSAFFSNPLTSVTMAGNAPAVIPARTQGWTDEGADAVPYQSSFGDSSGLKLTYPATASGYSSPTWNGYPAAPSGLQTLSAPTPTISGTPAVGQKLTAKAGSWTSGTALAYQWFAGGTRITGATASTLTLTSAHLGKTISVSATGSLPGYTPATKTSKLTNAVAAGTLTTATPTISGTRKVGMTLTAKPGTWTTGTTFSYQWYVGSSAISGATKSTFAPRASDAGKTIKVKVTGKKAGYTTASRTSASTATIAKASTLKTATPTISGTRKVGMTLTAKPGTWTTGTTFSYQWYVGSSAISGATKSTFVPRASDAGKTIKVKVTGKKAGYTTASRTSASTATIAK